MIARRPGEARKYEVIHTSGGWVVERSGERIAVFPTADRAIEHACKVARIDAEGGRLAIVTTQTDVNEFHCFTPPERAAVTPPAFPRLVFSR
jgi:hypothetical protein